MNLKYLLILWMILGICFSVFSRERQGRFDKSAIIGQIERMAVNRIDMPLENNGNMGQDGQAWFPNGQTSTSVLFAGGPAMSGFVNGELRTAWKASASRIHETQPGAWGTNPDAANAIFYIVDAQEDPQGGAAYQAWADAVAQGADYVDVDGDGEYDPNVDKPDFLGDKIIWCSYNDGTPASDRDRLNTAPMGIELHQHVWAFKRGDALGNVIFIRYRIINRNPEMRDINDFIFTAWVDPDLGEFSDDLIGCDIPTSMGYIYNDGNDAQYGGNPPAFGIDFFQGPIVESPGDTAVLARGPLLGRKLVPGFRNLPLTSFMYYIQSDPTLGDPNTAQEARWYQEGGLDRTGLPVNPANWGSGGVAGQVDSSFFYSGDPVTGTGWLDDTPSDKRFMVNTGPFELAYNDTQDVVVAYVVSRGGTALESMTVLRQEDELAQASYDNNFRAAPPIPLPLVRVKELDEKIELYIDLQDNLAYTGIDDVVGQLSWEGLQIWQINSGDTESEFVNGRPNLALIGTFDLDNNVGDLYADINAERVRIWDAQDNLDRNVFDNSGSGILKFTITTDAFNGNQPLVNFKQYRFAVVPFAVNTDLALPNDITGDPNDLVLPGGLFQPPRNAGAFTARPGASENNPFKEADAQRVSGSSQGYAEAEVLDREALTGQDYTITFFNNGENWRINNETSGQIEVDNLAFQGIVGDEITFPVVDGISMRVYNVPNNLNSASVNVAAGDSVWLRGRSNSGFGDSLVFNNGIGLATVDADKLPEIGLIPTIQKADYFPVQLVFETSNVHQGYFYRRPALNNTTYNDNNYAGVTDVYIAAYDISNPESPRQLNILFNAPPNGALSMASGNRNIIMVLNSDYNPGGDIYNPANGQSRNFREDVYLLMNLELAPGDVLNRNQFSVDVVPYYPNSDADKFAISGADLSPQLTTQESQNLLEKVKIVPNPYFAYSSYETSYDEPILKFTHIEGAATIRIFNVAGQLVKTLVKSDNLNEMTWDLRNEARLKIASGMYIAHIEVAGVGNKVLKFAVIQREDRIDRF